MVAMAILEKKVKKKKRHYSTNATLFDGDPAFCPRKCFSSEPEALADFLRLGSINTSGSKSQGYCDAKSAMRSLMRRIIRDR